MYNESMRVRESRSLLWYGLVFFALMALACVLWIAQNPINTIDNTSSGSDLSDKVTDQLF